MMNEELNGFEMRSPFTLALGMRLTGFGEGQADVELDLREELLNAFGVGHGGVTMSLLDVALSHAARRGDPLAPTGQWGRSVVTVELKTMFLRPAIAGILRAHGRVLRSAQALVFVEGSVFDHRGNQVAQGTGTFKYLRSKAEYAANTRNSNALQRGGI